MNRIAFAASYGLPAQGDSSAPEQRSSADPEEWVDGPAAEQPAATRAARTRSMDFMASSMPLARTRRVAPAALLLGGQDFQTHPLAEPATSPASRRPRRRAA